MREGVSRVERSYRDKTRRFVSVPRKRKVLVPLVPFRRLRGRFLGSGEREGRVASKKRLWIRENEKRIATLNLPSKRRLTINMGKDIAIETGLIRRQGHVSATVGYLQSESINIFQALDMELPDILAAEVFPRLSLQDTFNLAQTSRGLRDTVWSVQGVQSLRAKIGHLRRKGPTRHCQLTSDPLFWAVWNDSLPAVRALIQAGENVSAVYSFPSIPRNVTGLSVLHCAACKGHSAVVIELIKAGADVNATGMNGETPLHVATKTGKACVIAVLLGAGADANKVDNEGRRPLEVDIPPQACPANFCVKCGEKLSMKHDRNPYNNRLRAVGQHCKSCDSNSWFCSHCGGTMDVQSSRCLHEKCADECTKSATRLLTQYTVA